MIDSAYHTIAQGWSWIVGQSKPSFFLSLAAIIVAIIALSYRIRTYWLKAGEKVRFSYSLTANVEAEDKYIGSITLENLKDKALVIFEIYLKLGHGLYLELEKFDGAPLIVKPFEVYQREFDPVIFYSSNTKRVKLDDLLEGKRFKPHVVLSTTSGRYNVKANIRRWTPLGEYFGNAYSGIIQPRWLIHRGRGYGSQVRFLLDIEKHNGRKECIPICPDDYKHNSLRNLRLTKDAIETKESFNAFINEKLSDGTIDWKSYEIIDFRKEVEDIDGFLDADPIKLDQVGLLRYYVVGKVLNVLQNFQMSRKNRRLAKRRQEQRDRGTDASQG